MEEGKEPMTYPENQEDKNFDGLVEHDPPSYGTPEAPTVVRFEIAYPGQAPQHVDVRSDSIPEDRDVPIAGHCLHVQFDGAGVVLEFPPGMLGGSGSSRKRIRLEDGIVMAVKVMGGIEVTATWNPANP